MLPELPLGEQMNSYYTIKYPLPKEITYSSFRALDIHVLTFCY